MSLTLNESFKTMSYDESGRKGMVNNGRKKGRGKGRRLEEEARGEQMKT